MDKFPIIKMLERQTTFFSKLDSELTKEHKIILNSISKLYHAHVYGDKKYILDEYINMHKTDFKEKGRSKNIESDKYIINEDDFYEAIYFSNFEKLLEVINRKKEILLDCPDFIEYFGLLITVLIYQVGLAIHNLDDFIEGFVKKINECTRENYSVITCDKSYFCGRAVYIRTDPSKNSKILFYETNTEAIPQQEKVLARAEHISGGYYQKYLKYKTKYLKLKNQL